MVRILQQEIVRFHPSKGVCVCVFVGAAVRSPRELSGAPVLDIQSL